MSPAAKRKYDIERTLVSDIVNALERKLQKPSRSIKRPLLPDVIGAVLSIDSTPSKVSAAMSRLQRDFVDWNEVRVTNVRDIAATIRGVGDETGKAEAVKAMLSKVFTDRHDLYLDFLAELPDENLIAYLETIPGLRPLYRQAILVRALRHAALLLSEGTIRVLKRVGVLPKQKIDIEEASEALLAVVPKGVLFSFSVLAAAVAVSFCSVRRPSCPLCPLNVLCNSAKTSYRKRRR